MSAKSPRDDLAGAKVRVWDLPTRLVHWAIAALVPFSWWSAHAGHLPWHRLSGYSILGLVVFRLIWGVAGSSTSRFASFLRGPAAVLAYLRGGGEYQPRADPPSFSQVQRLNLQSLINAKGYPCPQPPSLHYEQKRSRGVVIVATCRLPNGESDRYEIDFKGHVRAG